MLVLRLCPRLAVRVKCVIANPLLTRPRFPLASQQTPQQYPASRCWRRMASTEAVPEKGTLHSPPKAGQIIQHEDKEFETVQEGLAYILVPPSKGDASTSSAKNGDSAEAPRQDVFYNPIQQFNRDLSVLAIRAFGEHVIAAKTEKHAARMKQKTRKRKREGEEVKEGELPDQLTAKKICHESNNESGKPALDAAAGDKADIKTAEPSIAPEEPWKPTFSILDALSATGLRALRYAKEIPFATRVVANDLSPLAIESMKLNIQHNGVEKIVQPNRGDACAYMYSAGAPKADKNATNGKFDAVDLDPYGTAVPFIDAAIQSVGDGGLLCITCTDAGVFAGAGYPEKTFALYGGSPIRGPHSHEGGLRLILNAIATSAAKYGISIEPLLSLSIDFYARVFVRVHKSPSETKFLASKTMVVYHCGYGCGSWKTQPLSEHKQKASKKGIPFYTYKLSQAPTTTPNCEQCGFKTHLSGPMWSGPLHNPHFIHRILSLLKESDKTTYPTYNRVEGMLTTALEEDLNLGGGGREDSPEIESEPAENNDTPKPSLALIPRTDASLVEPHPFFVMPSYLCKILHTATMPENMLRGALRHLGYRSTRSHIKPNSIRTDAPWPVIWEIVREWVRQKSPIKEGALSEGTAGAGIMRRSREKLNPTDGAGDNLRTLKRDLLSAVESGKSVAELTTKIEAALYRSGAHRAGEAVENSKTENGRNEESRLTSPGPKSEDDKILQEPDPSTLEIVFDEELGRKAAAAQRKRLVRYQINPRANWGPLSRASKGVRETQERET